MTDILARARSIALERGEGLTEAELLEVLELGDERLPELLDLAHQVRLRWCGEEVEIEGIISLKTGGCPEDCHFCSQSGLFESPVRSVQLDIAELVEAAKQTQKTGATEFCIVAAVKGPDERLMTQLEEAIAAVRAEVDINISVSVGILTPAQVARLNAAGVKRYNHNLESARSFFPQVATTHTWDDRHRTLELVRDAAMLRFAMPRTTLRFGGGRELTLGDLGVEKGLQGGANALIVGNYLTTLGRPMERDLDMLEGLRIPIKAVGQVI